MIALGLYLYFALGAVIALLVDRDQMRKQVPYGDFPALWRLATIRAAVAWFLVLLGVPMAARAFASAVVQGINREIELIRRARRRFRRRR